MLRYHAAMNAVIRSADILARIGARVLGRVAQWWRTVLISAQLVVMALQPNFWRDPAARAAVARQTLAATWVNLSWYSVMVMLAAAIITRIVFVTARSYGLSSYAIEMLVRVLVLELIPLSAALFVALRYSIARGSEVFKLRHRGGFATLQLRGQNPISLEVLPSALAGMFAVLALAAVTTVLTTALSYFMIYGLSPHGLAPYTRSVGKVFSPAVAVIFCAKTALFSLAVALTPLATALQNLDRDTSRVGVALEVLVRMFSLLLAVEVLSLAGNYT